MSQSVLPDTDDITVALIATALNLLRDKGEFLNGSIATRLELFVDVYEVLTAAHNVGAPIARQAIENMKKR
jgi:hypothetical protein